MGFWEKEPRRFFTRRQLLFGDSIGRRGEGTMFSCGNFEEVDAKRWRQKEFLSETMNDHGIITQGRT